MEAKENLLLKISPIRFSGGRISVNFPRIRELEKNREKSLAPTRSREGFFGETRTNHKWWLSNSESWHETWNDSLVPNSNFWQWFFLCVWMMRFCVWVLAWCYFGTDFYSLQNSRWLDLEQKMATSSDFDSWLTHFLQAGFLIVFDFDRKCFPIGYNFCGLDFPTKVKGGGSQSFPFSRLVNQPSPFLQNQSC